MICFVEILKQFENTLCNFLPELKEQCIECINSVGDFGMAMSLNSVWDKRILPDLDIFEYLVDIEKFTGISVAPDDEHLTSLF